MTDYLEPNNKKSRKKDQHNWEFKIAIIWGSIIFFTISLLALIIIISISASLNQWSILYGFLLIFGFSFVALTITISIPIIALNNKKRFNKKKLSLGFTGLYFLKNLLLIIPFIIAFCVKNANENNIIFNIWSMAGAFVIYLIADLITFPTLPWFKKIVLKYESRHRNK